CRSGARAASAGRGRSAVEHGLHGLGEGGGGVVAAGAEGGDGALAIGAGAVLAELELAFEPRDPELEADDGSAEGGAEGRGGVAHAPGLGAAGFVLVATGPASVSSPACSRESRGKPLASSPAGVAMTSCAKGAARGKARRTSGRSSLKCACRYIGASGALRRSLGSAGASVEAGVLRGPGSKPKHQTPASGHPASRQPSARRPFALAALGGVHEGGELLVGHAEPLRGLLGQGAVGDAALEAVG